MGSVGVNIIALNEAARLPRCLESVAWADEIVVVDGGSTDATVEVARSFGARVFIRPFDNFAAQRNYALQQTRAEWVLSLDADEVVTPGLKAEICRVVRSPAPFPGYRVPIHSWIFGRRFRFSGTMGETKLRFFRADSARWVGAVHERVRLRGRPGSLRHPILHFSTPDVDVFVRKMRRYSALAATPGAKATRVVAGAGMFVRRWVRHLGLLDGPEGLAFALLSAWEEWHRTCTQAALDRDHADSLLLRVSRWLTGSRWRRSPALRVCSRSPFSWLEREAVRSVG